VLWWQLAARIELMCWLNHAFGFELRQLFVEVS